LILLLELLGQIYDIAVPDSQPTQTQTAMTPEQLNLALAVQEAANQGYHHLAASLADMLRKQLKETKK